MAVCARGSVLGFFQLFGKGFSGSGADDHQLIFFIWPILEFNQ